MVLTGETGISCWIPKHSKVAVWIPVDAVVAATRLVHAGFLVVAIRPRGS